MKTLHRKDIFLQSNFMHVAERVRVEENKTHAHNHDFFELFIIEQGILHHYINSNMFTLTEKTLSLVYPDDVHFFKKDSSVQKVVFINIAFTKDFFQQVCAFLFGTPELLEFEETNRSLKLSDEAYEVFIDKIKRLKDITKDISLNDKTIVLKSILVEALTCLTGKRSIHIKQGPTWLSDCYNEMKKEENYTIGLSKLIQLSGRTQEHLTRYMKKYYGVTPTNYVNSLRLQKAG